MTDPIFWLGISLFLVAVSLTAVLMTALPAFQELGRASRSAEKLFDTLRQEFPPTLEALRLTGLDISELTGDLDQGIKKATGVVKQVDQGLNEAKQQIKQVEVGSRSVLAGVKAAWRVWTRPSSPKNPKMLDNEIEY